MLWKVAVREGGWCAWKAYIRKDCMDRLSQRLGVVDTVRIPLTWLRGKLRGGHPASRTASRSWEGWVGLCGVLLLCAGLLPAGCKKEAKTSGGLTKIRVGYIGLTCEAPIFTAVEKGFFKEEGLDVE